MQKMPYIKNKEGYIINKNNGSLVIDMLSRKPIHINNAKIQNKEVYDWKYLYNKLIGVLAYVNYPQRNILWDIFINDISNSSPSDIISKIIIEIMKTLEIPKEIQNMLLSLVPDHCDILLKIVDNIEFILDFNSDINFLFNNYNYLLNKNIGLIQNHFSLNNDITEEIRKILIKQAVKEDYRTLLFIPDHEITDKIILFAVENDEWAVKFISEDRFTDKLIRLAIRKNNESFKYIPEDKITDEIIRFAIKTNIYLFEFIQQDKITDKIIKFAIKNAEYDFDVCKFIPEDKITDEIIKLAIKEDKFTIDFIHNIPEDKITDEIIELANMHGYDYFLDD
jgi:hypothetical protein